MYKRHGLNYVTRDDNIILLDKNFNVLKSYSGDYVSDMSYINGVYYINTYSQYGEYIPETHMNVMCQRKNHIIQRILKIGMYTMRVVVYRL